MDNTNTLPARLALRGHSPSGAVLRAAWRSPRARATRAALSLLGFWAIAPIVFFIPPHLPWAAAAAVAGVYFALRQWTGEYVVEHFEGNCPRCGNPLPLATGTRIRLPHRMVCYHCHHEPSLEIHAAR